MAITDHPIAGETGLTWDEFLALPYETRNCALIDGEIVVNPPDAPHERRVMLAWQPSASGAFAELVELAEGDEIRSPLLDGFALAVADVFAR